ncbi:uncharacterized protein MONBRDRAFT_28861 [Monosiga brevicollis MX1]|uniref:Bud22 domain-containing protein n=1 Tax=Monosiga brevicollis TaxID=81824 RepID=A9V9A0_MONBE|nr:uncharacterized protein MONBRDRAFT_28861 [Monosiga brevicollis MX1]EDQ85825.1 predicted protein [Monosiga brevicollis MX1]|eukprot:XP_001749304.1 hypothetical protein [Monosiga brevicollis MX1]
MAAPALKLPKKTNVEYRIRLKRREQDWDAVQELLQEKAARKQHGVRTQLERAVTAERKKSLQLFHTNAKRASKAGDEDKAKTLETRRSALLEYSAEQLCALVLGEAEKPTAAPIQAALQRFTGNKTIKDLLQQYRVAGMAATPAVLEVAVQKMKTEAEEQAAAKAMARKNKGRNNKATDEASSNAPSDLSAAADQVDYQEEPMTDSDGEGQMGHFDSKSWSQMVDSVGHASDDDDSDDDEAELAQMRADLAAAEKQQKKKKNRLGQRARQMLAERKYGNDARHKKDPSKDANLRQQKQREKAQQDRRRARQEDRGSSRSRNGGETTAGRQPRSRGSGGSTSSAAAPAEPVHPSWQAKQMQKRQAVEIGAFSGKKIKFDD